MTHTQHITIYRQADRFAGWPANYGLWAWGNEIVVGFTLGYLDPAGEYHARDKTRPFRAMQARTVDGGETWTAAAFPGKTPGDTGLSADEHMAPALQAATALAQGGPNLPRPCPGGLDFGAPDFALMCARTGLGAGAQAWFYTSQDRCQSWQGPYRLPDFDQAGVEARTDYLVTGKHALLLFLTASKPSGGEGLGVFCAETEDGARSFRLRSWVTQVEGAGFAIMPASVRCASGEIVTAVRCLRPGKTAGQTHSFINLYASQDEARTWQARSQPVPDAGQHGNPPTLTRLQDERLCLTYGYRAPPYGIYARLSKDAGRTWSEPIVLRSGAGNQDLGYPRTVQRPDGGMVTVYYYNDHPEGERYLAATLWTV